MKSGGLNGKTFQLFFCILLILILIFPATTEAKSDETVYIETIGVFGGIYIYTTYAYIGTTADAFSKDIYDAGQVKSMMDEKINMLNNLEAMLLRVQATNMAPADKKFIASMLDIIGLLRQEASALSEFVNTKDEADAEKYDQARKAAWLKIKKLLGMK